MGNPPKNGHLSQYIPIVVPAAMFPDLHNYHNMKTQHNSGTKHMIILYSNFCNEKGTKAHIDNSKIKFLMACTVLE